MLSSNDLKYKLNYPVKMKVGETYSKIIKDYSGIIKPCRDFDKCSFTDVLCCITACSFSAATSADRFYRIDKAQVCLPLLLLQNHKACFLVYFLSHIPSFFPGSLGGFGGFVLGASPFRDRNLSG